MKESVVHLQEVEEEIVLLKMEDRVHKNTFSDELMEGLSQAFQTIADEPKYKAVIMTGYDSYFCSGGTKETLLAIYKGESRFADSNIYSLSMDCKIPVISAMQGHGIGGGFAFGLFSDFVILSRESVYTANFMKYGFTPAFGSTMVLTEKLGIALAEEMMLTADNYRGSELKERGIPFPVLPRKDILPHAFELARNLAEKPRLSLITLKNHLVEHLRKKLPATIEKELIMHEKTFHQPEVEERIKRLFGS